MQVHEWCAGLPKFQFPFDPNELPRNGIYILFEADETAHNTDRIVRIGTHTGHNQLRPRLRQHFVQEKKDRSIFRKNIGRALLKQDGDPFLAFWELDLTTKKARQSHAATIDFVKQAGVEQAVTNYMRSRFRFSVFQVDDKVERLRWESKLISTISLCSECLPSPNWLGLHSPKPQIRTSGLWLVNELNKQPLTEDELSLLEMLHV